MRLKPKSLGLGATILVCFFVLGGCTSPRIEHTLRDMPIGPSYEPANVFAEEKLPEGIFRVMVLPVLGVTQEFAPEDVEESLITALRSQGRFELVVIERDELGRISPVALPRISTSRQLSQAILTLASRYAVDAVMQIEMSHYRPYKPLQLGVRARLVHLKEPSEVIWSIDEIFDSGDKKVAIAARKYGEEFVDQPFPLQSSFSVLMSPSRYAAYVGHAVFETLPVRVE